jgi:RNA polymerase sigma-70 factor (ECF subfamily)
MDRSDDGLLAAARSGDRAALGRLLERYGPEVRTTLSGRIPRKWQSQLSTDDVLQQTYTDAFLCFSRYTGAGVEGLAGWLVTLGRRNLIDALRMLEADKRGGDRQRVEPRSLDDSLTSLCEVLGVTSQTPSRVVAKDEASRRVLQVIARLPEAYRNVIRQYDLEGRSADELAQAMGRSPGAVFMLRARAHERLAELMGPAAQFFSDAP